MMPHTQDPPEDPYRAPVYSCSDCECFVNVSSRSFSASASWHALTRLHVKYPDCGRRDSCETCRGSVYNSVAFIVCVLAGQMRPNACTNAGLRKRNRQPNAVPNAMRNRQPQATDNAMRNATKSGMLDVYDHDARKQHQDT